MQPKHIYNAQRLFVRGKTVVCFCRMSKNSSWKVLDMFSRMWASPDPCGPNLLMSWKKWPWAKCVRDGEGTLKNPGAGSNQREEGDTQTELDRGTQRNTPMGKKTNKDKTTYKPMTFFPVFGRQKKRHTNLWLFSQFSDGKKNKIQTYDFLTSFRTT